jgi:hypothetical protein
MRTVYFGMEDIVVKYSSMYIERAFDNTLNART